MSRIVYVNGEYLPEEQAKISVFDRGFLFADGIYEVTSVLNGKLVDNAAHLARMRRSIAAIGLPSPGSDEEVEAIQKQMIVRNNLDEGTVYLQVTRGVADRDFAYPKNPKAGLVMFTQARSLIASPMAERGIKVKSIDEIRWLKRDIKTVGLLPASMMKQEAIDAGFDDAWMVENGTVTEGSSNNACIVTHGGVLVTRQLGSEILPGCTRAAVLRLSREDGLTVEERPFTLAEAYDSAEAFSTSASTFVMPVIQIDDRVIGDGKPGPVARKLRRLYIEAALAAAG
ncbi:MAG: D-amino-acid transaminase [Ectothiorhodospiraceae bacterium]|nr:D-amino-acid transaminase [Ectothiorhodospiraceae bacterium]